MLELGRGRKFGPHEGRDLGLAGGIPRHLHREFPHTVVPHNLAADQERVTGGKGRGKALLYLAQGFEIAFHADLERICVLDRADVHADHPGGAGVAELPRPVGCLQQPFPLVIGAQGVAAGRTEIEAVVKLGSGQASESPDAGDFAVKFIGLKRPRTRSDQDVLGTGRRGGRGLLGRRLGRGL